MTRTPKTLRDLIRALLMGAILMCWIPTAWADAYSEARADLVAAYQDGDFGTMRAAAEQALAARPGHA